MLDSGEYSDEHFYSRTERILFDSGVDPEAKPGAASGRSEDWRNQELRSGAFPGKRSFGGDE